MVNWQIFSFECARLKQQSPLTLFLLYAVNKPEVCRKVSWKKEMLSAGFRQEK